MKSLNTCISSTDHQGATVVVAKISRITWRLQENNLTSYFIFSLCKHCKNVSTAHGALSRLSIFSPFQTYIHFLLLFLSFCPLFSPPFISVLSSSVYIILRVPSTDFLATYCIWSPLSACVLVIFFSLDLYFPAHFGLSEPPFYYFKFIPLLSVSPSLSPPPQK